MLDPKVRRILMQSLLVVVFAAAMGLAALVTRHVRRSMRVELGEARTFGRLVVKLPLKWSSSPTPADKGDGIEVEEPVDETQVAAGRRLRVMRQKSDGLVSPLEHLSRSGQVSADTLRALAEGRDGFSISDVPVAGWPGQMLTTLSSPRAGVIHKDVLACAMLPGSQVVVIELQGLGPLDASDTELVRQMGENVSLTMQSGAGVASAGARVTLPDEVGVTAPPRFVVLPEDDANDFQQRLLFDGSRGRGWVAVELASCVFFADDTEETFTTMLSARDPDWRSGPVKQLTPTTWMADRVDAAGQRTAFPSRAYLTAWNDGRALMVVMRGGPGDAGQFDSAWASIASSVRFAKSKDLSSLLINGAAAARAIAAPAPAGPPDDFDDLDDDDANGSRSRGGAVARLREGSGSRRWSTWDAAENADKVSWSTERWQVTKGGAGEPDGLSGARTALPVDPYAADSQYEQQWSAAGDMSRYQVTTFREVRRPGNQFPKQVQEQWVNVERGRLTLKAGEVSREMATPGQYVPGALLPLVLRELAERPALVKTESYVGLDTLAPAGLLTLFVTRLTDSPVRLDENGDAMDCVTVSVNGTGQVSRWYFSADHALRFIDFPGGLKAQAGEGK